jgi:2,3-bisphosphoglycerate-independent phosphoglycerate mutase
MTKYIICLGDGMADEPVEILGGKTPLEVADAPNMTQLAKEGQVGLVHTVPEGLHPGSDVANMGILGYDPNEYYTGRGPIEAAAMGISVPEGKLIFRCNLVTIENGIMKDFTAGHISNEEGAQLLNELNEHFGVDVAEFFPGVGYRNIALLDEKFLNLTSTAPHDITDKPVQDFWPKGDTENDLLSFIEECQTVMAKSEVNQKRIKEGKNPATSIWPWSQGPLPKLPSFKEKYNLTGGIVTAVDLLKGLGKLSGLETPHIDGATGFIDTNYANKVKAGFEILENHDFLYLHIEAPDECGHMGDAKLKTKAIEDFDKNVIGPVMDYQKENPDTVILVLPDHPTPCNIKTHTNAAVPYILHYPGIESDTAVHYDEFSAEKTNTVHHTPWELLEHFLHQKQLQTT